MRNSRPKISSLGGRVECSGCSSTQQMISTNEVIYHFSDDLPKLEGRDPVMNRYWIQVKLGFSVVIVLPLDDEVLQEL